MKDESNDNNNECKTVFETLSECEIIDSIKVLRFIRDIQNQSLKESGLVEDIKLIILSGQLSQKNMNNYMNRYGFNEKRLIQLIRSQSFREMIFEKYHKETDENRFQKYAKRAFIIFGVFSILILGISFISSTSRAVSFWEVFVNFTTGQVYSGNPADQEVKLEYSPQGRIPAGYVFGYTEAGEQPGEGRIYYNAVDGSDNQIIFKLFKGDIATNAEAVENGTLFGNPAASYTDGAVNTLYGYYNTQLHVELVGEIDIEEMRAFLETVNFPKKEVLDEQKTW